MPKLPRVSGKEVIKALERAGFEVFDQTGSHVYLHKWERENWSKRITIPVHGKKILKLKTLRNIIKESGLKVDEFVELL